MTLRVVIRAFTCRRDTPSFEVLAKLLEHLGCEVLVTSMRDFGRTLKYWKPDVAVVNALGSVDYVRELSPDAKVVFFDGEGLIPPEHSLASVFSRHPEYLDKIDLSLIWGERTYRELAQVLSEQELTKFKVVGYADLDIIKFGPESFKHNDQSNSLGFVMRFNSINDHGGAPLIRTLPNPGNLERVTMQCRSFVSLIECMREILEKTDFNISIRPHPVEQVESYEAYKERWLGKALSKRVEIDRTLSFSEWAIAQKYLISPTSTSFLAAYLLNIPVVNIDLISDTDDFNRKQAEICREWQNAGLTPTDYEELISLISNPTPDVERNADIEKQLEEYCHFKSDTSASYEAAKHIHQLGIQGGAPFKLRWPTWVINKADDISFSRAMRRNPLHQNMNYKRGFHKLPNFTEELVANIIQHKRRG